MVAPCSLGLICILHFVPKPHPRKEICYTSNWLGQGNGFQGTEKQPKVWNLHLFLSLHSPPPRSIQAVYVKSALQAYFCQAGAIKWLVQASLATPFRPPFSSKQTPILKVPCGPKYSDHSNPECEQRSWVLVWDP